jgi:hypothetical protein
MSLKGEKSSLVMVLEALRNWARRRCRDRNFGADAARDVQDWVHDMIDAKPLEISMRLESQSQLNSKYLSFVSLRGASRDPGKDVINFLCSLVATASSVVVQICGLRRWIA